MELKEVMKELASYADQRTKNTLMNHGGREPIFGVKVGDLKKILKKTRKNHGLSLALYDTGNSDAMYLAGLMADEKQITKDQLNNWVEKAYWYYLSEYAVAWVAAESKYGFDLGLEWIRSDKESVASAGWSTLSNYASINTVLDLDTYSSLLDEVNKTIHDAKNRVKYTMNGFVIAVGSYVPELSEKAKLVAKNIGKVDVFMGGTSCKVPLATDYIAKVENRGSVGKKRKQARC
ncbi:DNA alkylation repair protein [Lutimonas zeaxanthinifaciens]|uniref:DNA alkylation repair protein n=1 Tax=Lutimonas zeaxanthinifaciens TaxID=3060215 RepID=UPI00265CBF10|nr:DNA alkylation repair protein [Lutimonas sp. YSD2104]WKK65583.1 DNA alkylation repair protein [Lutimonas sp. YSD2104]